MSFIFIIHLHVPPQDCGSAAAQCHHRSALRAVVYDPRTEREADDGGREAPKLSEVSPTTSD